MMTREEFLLPVGDREPDYEYGNRPEIEVVRLVPIQSGLLLDAHASLVHDPNPESPFTEEELQAKVEEIAENYLIIGDPKSTESEPKQFGITIANKNKLDAGMPAILMVSTNGSSLYKKNGKPRNAGNALELAYTALKYPEQPVVYVEAPGNGNSVDLTNDEYKHAAKDGRLVEIAQDEFGNITDAEAIETMQALARALNDTGIKNISHISVNATGVPFASALGVALPADTLERAFLYNTINISDRTFLGLTLAGLKEELITQRRYKEVSKDPLRLTDEQMEMAHQVLAAASKYKSGRSQPSTHDPRKLYRRQKIFRRGNTHGQAAAVHAVAMQRRHPNLRQTHVVPEFVSHYKHPQDIVRFVQLINALGGNAVRAGDIETLKIPWGQYGHSHFPTVRQTLESRGFHR